MEKYYVKQTKFHEGSKDSFIIKFETLKDARAYFKYACENSSSDFIELRSYLSREGHQNKILSHWINPKNLIDWENI